jgi:hypothetical protein
MSPEFEPAPATRRRGFLASLGGLAAAPTLTAVFVSGDLYINNAFGIAFRKPASWKFEHVRTFADLRNEYEFATPNAALVQELRSGPLPLTVISQAPVLRSLASSMTIYAEENPFREGETLLQGSAEIMRGLESILEQFEVTTQPHRVDVAGAEAIEYVATFLYKDRLGNKGPVRNRGLLLLRAPHVFTLNMLDIPADNIVADAEFIEVKRSLVFA